MPNPKAIPPYVRLKDAFRSFASKALHPKRVHTMTYRAGRDSPSYCLRDLHQRALAAQQCGREAVLQANEDGTLEVHLVTKRPEWPTELMG